MALGTHFWGVSGAHTLDVLAAVALDTETTGLDTSVCHILQFGACVINGTQDDDNNTLNLLVKPGISITPDNTAIHGITNDDVKDAPLFNAVFPAVQEFIGGRIIVGHNTGFDLAVIRKELQRQGMTWVQPRYLDTVVLTRIAALPVRDYNLETIANVLGVPFENRHDALGDARITAAVFNALIPLLAQRGIRTLAQTERASRALDGAWRPQVLTGWEQPVLSVNESLDRARGIRIDSHAYQQRVGDAMTGIATPTSSDMKISDAARQLAESSESALLVKLRESEYIEPAENLGIVTERDLMRVLTSEHVDAQSRVREIANSPIHTIRNDAFVYQAIARMHRLSLRHLVVTDENENIIGVINAKDLLDQRASDALILGDAICEAENAEQLKDFWARLPVVGRSMMQEGLSAREVTAVISEELCLLTARSAEFAEESLLADGRGAAPRDYAVLVLGSGGRGESMLIPDQDNAVVYADPPLEYANNPVAAAEVDEWFNEFGQLLTDNLNGAGIPYCNGGVMASNSAWRHSISDWSNHVSTWAGRATNSDMLSTDIFFDFRCVAGDRSLAEQLESHAWKEAFESRLLQSQLGSLTAQHHPPVGLFGRLKTSNGRINLKLNGLLPLVSTARVLALRHGITERGTVDRYRAYQRLGVSNSDEIQSLIEAHTIISNEILAQQLHDTENGSPLSTAVDMNRLNRQRRTRLRDAVKATSIVPGLIATDV